MRIGKKDIWLFTAQAAVWVFILLALPTATMISTRDWQLTRTSWLMAWNLLHSPFILYFANFYILGPYLFFRRRYWLFALGNLLLIGGLNYGFVYLRGNVPAMPTTAWIGMFLGFFMFLLLNVIVIATAIGIRHFIRTRQIRQQLKDEKAKNTEAELAWLKNQINPHFLFNTLNNISSLTQIDAAAAQDAIAQLSDLLRYAMYETNKQTVPISGEAEFMRNYISLMQLRCNEQTEVTTAFDLHEEMEIAPLLFISLIENAFKHGISSSRPSRIDIRLLQDAGGLTFSCDNTNYPKNDADRSGSGIGLENTRRRLELMYHGRYRWEQSLTETPDGTGIYHVCIKLKP